MFQKLSRPIAQGGKRFARKNVFLAGALVLSAFFVISACEDQFNTLTISGDPSGAVGDPDVQLMANYSSAEGFTDVTGSALWWVVDFAIAQISGPGLVRPLSSGNTEIVVSYNGLQATHAFGVTGGAAAAASFSIQPTNFTVETGGTGPMQADYTPPGGGAPTNVTGAANWSSDDPTIVTVSNTGLVTAGRFLDSTTVWANYTDPDGTAWSESATVTVGPIDIGPAPVVNYTGQADSVAPGSSYYQISVAKGDWSFTLSGLTLDADLYVYVDPTFDLMMASSATGGTVPETVVVPCVYNAGCTFGIEVDEWEAGTQNITLDVNAVGAPPLLFDWDDGVFPLLGWTTSGAGGPWVNSTYGSFTGTNSLSVGQTGADLIDGDNACVEFASGGPVTLIYFNYRTSTEDTWDFLDFYIDDMVNPVNSFTGENTWTGIYYPGLPATTHTFKWCYFKDGTGSGGLDNVSIDDIYMSN